MTKPSLLSTDIPIAFSISSAGTVSGYRNGKDHNTKQTFVIPKGKVSVGDVLVHRQTLQVFRVTSEDENGFVLQDQELRDASREWTANFKVIKQSCWLLIEGPEDCGPDTKDPT